MIDEKRVRRMERMAAYEKKEGREDRKINAFFRTDYLTKQVLLTFICETAAFAILFGAYAIYNFEELIEQVYSMDLRVFLLRILTYYLIFMGIMIGITLWVYNERYRRARRHLNAYYQDLQRLSAGYRKGR